MFGIVARCDIKSHEGGASERKSCRSNSIATIIIATINNKPWAGGSNRNVSKTEWIIVTQITNVTTIVGGHGRKRGRSWDKLAMETQIRENQRPTLRVQEWHDESRLALTRTAGKSDLSWKKNVWFTNANEPVPRTRWWVTMKYAKSEAREINFTAKYDENKWKRRSSRNAFHFKAFHAHGQWPIFTCKMSNIRKNEIDWCPKNDDTLGTYAMKTALCSEWSKTRG